MKQTSRNSSLSSPDREAPDHEPGDVVCEVDARLGELGPHSKSQDPSVSKGGPVSGRISPVGLVQCAEAGHTGVQTTLRIPEGGAAVLQFSVPDWLSGEPTDPAARAQRVLVLLVETEP